MATDNSLANKHRPKSFSDVIGQDFVVGALRGSIDRDDFPSAILFAGPSGTGKTTLARLLALYFNCADLQNKEPCGICGSCKAMQPLLNGHADSPDVVELNAALHGGIELIRRLESLVTLSPRYKNRVFILDEAQQITHSAFGGALKLIEDSPNSTKFIFCTTNPEKLPDTILGRCTKYKLSPVDNTLVAKHIFRIAKSEDFSLPDDKLKPLCLAISSATGGDVRESITMLDTVINFVVGVGGVDKVNDAIQKKIITEVISAAPYVVVQRYVSAVFSNSKAKSFLAIKLAENPESFVRRVLETFHQIFYRWIDPENLADQDKAWMLRGVEFPDQARGRALLSNTLVAEIVLDEYARALERIKTYVSDPTTILQLATLRVMKALHNTPAISE